MSQITNDGLTPSGKGCFIAAPIRQQWASKGYITIGTFLQARQILLHSNLCLSRSDAPDNSNTRPKMFVWKIPHTVHMAKFVSFQ